MNVKLFWVLSLICWPYLLTAQPVDKQNSAVFDLSDLEELLMANHPVVRQAHLLSEEAKAQIAQARGKFDPVLKADFHKKYFGGTDYYNDWHSELKVPLWVAGADLKVAYDRNVGAYVNPQSRTSGSGLSGVGIGIPLGQGFFIDNRRNVLRQAKAMFHYAEASKVSEINAIWLSAVKDYWQWYLAYRQFELLNEGVKLAQKRFDAIRLQTRLGDKPRIDSVEAEITLQERQIQAAKYQVELQNARLMLSNHLWSQEQIPLELPEEAQPPKVDLEQFVPDPVVLDTLLKAAGLQHPDLLKLKSKSWQLSVEEQYRRELLKPKLNITGTLISNRRSFGEYLPDAYDFNWSNYKFGLEFAFPLFLREERGKLKEVRIKQEQLNYTRMLTERNINNEVVSVFNDLGAYSSQLKLQTLSIENQEALLQGELEKFDLGESTLFIINSREHKLIDMRIKREDLISGYYKSLAELYYKAGTRLVGPEKL